MDAGASSLSVTSNDMLNAKINRRKVQQDKELMANRLNRLRQEEKKAKQKLLETKLRGDEILALQKRNAQAQEARSLAKRIDEEQRLMERQQQRLRLQRPPLSLAVGSLQTSQKRRLRLAPRSAIVA